MFCTPAFFMLCNESISLEADTETWERTDSTQSQQLVMNHQSLLSSVQMAELPKHLCYLTED